MGLQDCKVKMLLGGQTQPGHCSESESGVQLLCTEVKQKQLLVSAALVTPQEGSGLESQGSRQPVPGDEPGSDRKMDPHSPNTTAHET